MTLTIFFLILLSIIAQFIFLFYIDSSSNSAQYRKNQFAKLKARIINFFMRNVHKRFKLHWT